MCQDLHPQDNPGEAAVYPPARGGNTLIDPDHYQAVAGGMARGAGAGAIVARIHTQATEIGAARMLGPFEAEEEAAGEMLLLLLQYAAARKFSLWDATARVLDERRMAGGLALLVGVPR